MTHPQKKGGLEAKTDMLPSPDPCRQQLTRPGTHAREVSGDTEIPLASD